MFALKYRRYINVSSALGPKLCEELDDFESNFRTIPHYYISRYNLQAIGINKTWYILYQTL